ncbi:ATP-grasp domain-containing protein [Virgibacillus siamensis]|uniref:ATP-grasp domain-containing protein n=1 Tax=Virgibacillus siamensis TaxID=480071 RepID=UPI000985E0E1|nr:RimK family alpha-L-glutamate ligase [Virgibacillus siamensis]
MNPKGWIIYNGHLPGNKFLDFAEWIQAATERQNVQTKIVKNNELLSYLTETSLDLLRNNGMGLPDFAVFTDKDIYLARQLEFLGVQVFNSARTIEISDDKIASYQALAFHGLPIPRTVAAPKMFASSPSFNPDDYQAAIDKFGFPMIIKEAFGSFGEQVYLVQNKDEMYIKLKELQGKPFVLQEFVSTSYGRDIRLHVTGEKVVASMMRHAPNDFRANVTAGGAMQPYGPSEYEMNLAIAATKAIGAEFAGVDLLLGPNEKRLVCEINSNAHIRNIYNCTGINVAESIIGHIMKIMQNGGYHE